MTDNERLNQIICELEAAESHGAIFRASHTQTKFLLDKIDQYRSFIEQIACGKYDSPSISHEEIRSDAIDILAEELKED